MILLDPRSKLEDFAVWTHAIQAANIPHILCWYQEFLCPVEPLYFLDEKSTTIEKW